MSDLHAMESFPDEGWAEIRFFSMNTLVRMRGWVRPSSGFAPGKVASLERALEDARLSCLRYENLFSRTIPGSDVSRINASGGDAVRVNPETAEVVRAACEYCEKSHGTFDITIGAITALWDFHTGHIPEEKDIEVAKDRVDYRGIDLYEKEGVHYIKLADPNAKIDLGGIAKGWAVDRLLRQLMDSGLMGALVDIGGNVGVSGKKPDGLPWKIGLKKPFSPLGSERVLGTVELSSGAIATSGIYERSFEEGGELFHHILDPQTGYPLETRWRAVSVVADNALDAEGFSTTLLSMDMDEARELLDDELAISQVFFIDGEHEASALYPESMMPR